jgi:hypothetical protein
MSEINKKLLKHSSIYGLMLAGILVLINLVSYIFGLNGGNKLFGILIMIIIMAIMASIMAVASAKFRDKYLDGKINFLKCWAIGLVIAFIAVVIITLYSYVFNKLLDPSVLRDQLNQQIDEISSREGMPEESLEKIISMMRFMFSPKGMAILTLIMMGSNAFFMALLSTLFVRKKEKVSESPIY